MPGCAESVSGPASVQLAGHLLVHENRRVVNHRRSLPSQSGTLAITKLALWEGGRAGIRYSEVLHESCCKDLWLICGQGGGYVMKG